MDFTTTPGLLTARGWGLALASVTALLAAYVMGRRDLLVLAVFLLAVPLLAALSLRLVRPAFDVERTFSPPVAETGVPVTVSLTLRSDRPFRQSASMREGLPLRFGQSPVFRFPARVTSPDGGSMYEYQLRSARRGLFPIGPVSAEFHDMFGLARATHTLGGTDPLVVAPAPLDLPRVVLGGPHGMQGSAAGPRRGSPSEDDVSTREYRPGDPMRRVHWAATARHGELMVRQEEPVTSPSATLLLDAREGCYAGGPGSSLWLDSATGNGLVTSESFEWAVTAAVSVAAYLTDNGYALHLMDASARPALERSPSALDPRQRDFSGAAGLQDLAEGLAALGLDTKAATDRSERPERVAARAVPAGRMPPVRRSTRLARFKPRGSRLTGGTPPPGAGRGSTGGPAGPGGSGVPAGAGVGAGVNGERLMDSLVHRRRGPLVAVLGQLSAADARQLAPAADHASRAYAVLVSERPQDAGPALSVLRAGGWEAVAAAPDTDLARVWAALGTPTASASPSPTVSPTANREPRR